jgi:hypothetical protein
MLLSRTQRKVLTDLLYKAQWDLNNVCKIAEGTYLQVKDFYPLRTLQLLWRSSAKDQGLTYYYKTEQYNVQINNVLDSVDGYNGFKQLWSDYLDSSMAFKEKLLSLSCTLVRNQHL